MRRLAVLVPLLGLVLAPASPALAAADVQSEPSEHVASTNGTVTEVTTYREVGSGRTVTYQRTVAAPADGPVELTFDTDHVSAMLGSPGLASTTSAGVFACFEGGKTFTHHINAGKITARYSVRWCGSGGKVTSASNLWCSGTASGAREYHGCSVNHTGVGTSKLNISGSWNFKIWVPGVPFPISQPLSLSATHNPNGSYTGSWCLNC